MTSILSEMKQHYYNAHTPKVHHWCMGIDAYDKFENILGDRIRMFELGEEYGFQQEFSYRFNGVPVLLDMNLPPDMVKPISKEMWESVKA